MQESSSAAAAAGVLSPHVTAVVLPTPGSSFEGATDAAHTTALGLSAFSSSLIMVLPTPPDAESSSSASKQPGDTQLPLQLQHDITWTDDASAALNAAASIAHATGAAWLFVAVAGDIVTVQDGALLLQQLQHSCKSEQVLACHSNLQESWAQVSPAGGVVQCGASSTNLQFRGFNKHSVRRGGLLQAVSQADLLQLCTCPPTFLSAFMQWHTSQCDSVCFQAANVLAIQ
jgi:hypothetical protein